MKTPIKFSNPLLKESLPSGENISVVRFREIGAILKRLDAINSVHMEKLFRDFDRFDGRFHKALSNIFSDEKIQSFFKKKTLSSDEVLDFQKILTEKLKPVVTTLEKSEKARIQKISAFQEPIAGKSFLESISERMAKKFPGISTASFGKERLSQIADIASESAKNGIIALTKTAKRNIKMTAATGVVAVIIISALSESSYSNSFVQKRLAAQLEKSHVTTKASSIEYDVTSSTLAKAMNGSSTIDDVKTNFPQVHSMLEKIKDGSSVSVQEIGAAINSMSIEEIKGFRENPNFSEDIAGIFTKMQDYIIGKGEISIDGKSVSVSFSSKADKDILLAYLKYTGARTESILDQSTSQFNEYYGNRFGEGRSEAENAIKIVKSSTEAYGEIIEKIEKNDSSLSFRSLPSLVNINRRDKSGLEGIHTGIYNIGGITIKSDGTLKMSIPNFRMKNNDKIRYPFRTFQVTKTSNG